MSMIRPQGSGRGGSVLPFMRSIASPRAGLVIVSDIDGPVDWPKAEGDTEANLGHALGWTCEVRSRDILLIDPLGEGLIKAPRPELSPAWFDNVTHDASCAVYLAPTESESGFAELTISAAAAAGHLLAATVRTAVTGDRDQPKVVGRNEPCPCGSGRKFKHCHG